MDEFNEEVFEKYLATIGARPIAYQKIYAQITGSVTAGLLLSQIKYWAIDKGYTEFYKTDSEFSLELGMTKGELTHAKKILETMGIITLTKKGIPAISYYKLALQKMYNLLKGFRYTGSKETTKVNNTENTSENTSESKRYKTPTSNFLSTLSTNKQKEVLDVYDYWNSYKGEPGWHSHNKLTFDIIKAILENLKDYPFEEICIAIENYATVLTNDEYFWDYTWPLSTFLSVKVEKKAGAPKKWWQFLPENFIEKNYFKQEERKSSLVPLKDPDPELTEEIIDKYCQLIGAKYEGYTLTPERKNKFIQTTIAMIEFFSTSKGRIPKTAWVDYLMECMQKEYGDRDITIHPGHLCGPSTWDTLMTQHLKCLGVWYE